MNKEFLIFAGLLVVAYFIYNRQENRSKPQAQASLNPEPYWKTIPLTRN